MQIKDVEALAELARLELNAEEKEALLHDMEGILDYVKQIESVEEDIVEIKYDVYNVWREDILEVRDFNIKSIKDQFPAQQDDFLKAKKIL